MIKHTVALTFNLEDGVDPTEALKVINNTEIIQFLYCPDHLTVALVMVNKESYTTLEHNRCLLNKLKTLHEENIQSGIGFILDQLIKQRKSKSESIQEDVPNDKPGPEQY